MRRLNDHAVVLGAGMAGLLAARVLADAYERVTLVERDLLAETASDRRGVPQGRHAHLLVPRGTQIIDELLPGLVEDMNADGLPVIRDFAEMSFAPGGHLLKLRGRPGQPFICQAGRPYLERAVRARVRELPTVEILDRCEVVGLTTTQVRDRVTGVRILHLDPDGVEETLGADLVVDATGRGGRTPAWLAAMGYDQPLEQRLTIQLMYATRHLRLGPGALGGRKVISIGARPERPTSFVLIAQERDRWVLTAIGYEQHHPPTDPEGFLNFIQKIAPPEVFDAIERAEPLDDIVAHRFPVNLRRRYERLHRFPAGLLVIGDAICSTNPAYALGMSVAALQAEALREALAGGDRHLAQRFFRAAAKPVGMAWQSALGADLALPQVTGPRPLPVRLINAYIDRVLTAAERDPEVAQRFLRVTALQDPPMRLFRTSTALRVLLDNLRRRPPKAPTLDKRVHQTDNPRSTHAG